MNQIPDHKPKQPIAEHLFRSFYKEVFSSLVIKFGAKHITIIEDALQDTFYKALQTWQHNTLPKNPKAWLFTVTKNQILNELKRYAKSKALEDAELSIEEAVNSQSEEAQLILLLACAKLDIKPQAKLIFTLKSICGFGASEIANSLQLTEENIYKQLQRAKHKLKKLPKDYFNDFNRYSFTNNDVKYILQITYFMFNEGYDSVSNSSKSAINQEICFEAVRITHLLEKQYSSSQLKNVLALYYFHMSRFNSRIDDKGYFVSLRHQDRNKWDKQLISMAMRYLEQPKILDRYYIEALIASIHASAITFKDTKWGDILKLYDVLLKLNDSAIVRLNRAICLFELGDKKIALAELKAIKPELENSYMYYSISMAEYLEDKDIEMAKYWYEKSLEQTKQDFRKDIIKKRLNDSY